MLAIVIVSYNTRSDLENCLRSLHEHPPRVSHEIVVVDNASRDGSVEAVRAQWPGVRVIALESNVGFASANNEGIRRDRQRAGAAAQQRHDRARTVRSIASIAALRRASRRGGRRTEDRGRRRAVRSCRTAA